MSRLAAAADRVVPKPAKRRWGYLVWLIAAVVNGVPEITAAFDSGALPFTTISGMTGHLERHHNWVELVVVSLIVLAVFSIVRVSPRTTSGVQPSGADGGEQALPDQAGAEGTDAEVAASTIRTPGGRLTLRPEAVERTSDEFDDDEAPALFAVAAFASLLAIAIGTWAATRWWDDAHHYHPAYVLYGALGLLWVVVPSVLALIRGLDMPFPTLFRTIGNLEEWLQTRTRPANAGPLLALLVSYVIFAGLAILLLHLTLYPYPDITKILNPHG